MYENVIDFIRKSFGGAEKIPLHEPKFTGNEKKYLNDCIDSTFVSSVGRYVDEFERVIAEYTGAKRAVATTNGTSALHAALVICGVETGDEVITQPLTFIATANAISYCGATPLFTDVDKDTMGMSADALEDMLKNRAEMRGDRCYDKITGRKISACVPMHTFGLPCRIEKIAEICGRYGIALVEDAAESLGSFCGGRHTGTFGKAGILSFNGNKIVTSGGGGCILTDDEELGRLAKHITTTAKIPHRWEYTHDMTGFNYRLPNINAALLVAQLENLEKFLESKRVLHSEYINYFKNSDIYIADAREGTASNYWLNALILKDKEHRDIFLTETNDQGVMTRPIWTLMNRMPMFAGCEADGLANAQWLEERVVNIPSSARI